MRIEKSTEPVPVEVPTTTEALRCLIGKTLTGVTETPHGIMLEFSDGTVLWWRS